MNQLDTSGSVHETQDNPPRFYPCPMMWSDLDPFTQGYVEALLHAFYRQEQAIAAARLGRSPMAAYARYCFRHLAPETLAAILKDCEAFCEGVPGLAGDNLHGGLFWTSRSRGDLATCGFPPLTPYLGDDGKVYLRPSAA